MGWQSKVHRPNVVNVSFPGDRPTYCWDIAIQRFSNGGCPLSWIFEIRDLNRVNMASNCHFV